MVHLSLLVGQLTRSVARCLVHYVGRLHLQIAALACLLKEERFECALQTRHLSNVERETGARNLYAHVEVNEVVLAAKVPVAQCIRTELGHRAALFHNDIVRCVLAFRHVVVGYVGY